MSREILATVADNEAFQHALIVYNEALLNFHTLPAEAEASERQAAQLTFKSAGNGLQAAIDSFVVDRLCETLRKMRR